MPRKFSSSQNPVNPVKVILPFTQLDGHLEEVKTGPFLRRQFSFTGSLTDVLIYIGSVSYEPSTKGKEILLEVTLELGTDRMHSKILVKQGMNDLRNGFAFARGSRVTVSLESQCTLGDVWFSAIAKCRPTKNMQLVQVDMESENNDEGIRLQDSERTLAGVTARLPGSSEHP